MSIVLSEELAEAALRAASKAGYKSVVQDLIKSGVKASAANGFAVKLAEFHGHKEVADVLRTAIMNEDANSAPRPSPPFP